VSLRALLNREQSERRFSYMPFILKAISLSLLEHPMMQGKMEMEKEVIKLFNEVHLGVAVDTEEGLIVPVLRNVEKQSIEEIDENLKKSVQAAKENTLSLKSIQGSTFSVTNYGSVAGLYGTPILNDGNVAILGLGRIEKKPIVLEDKVSISYRLPLSLTIDHRLIDGGLAGRFLNTLMTYLRIPEKMFLK